MQLVMVTPEYRVRVTGALRLYGNIPTVNYGNVWNDNGFALIYVLCK